MSVASEKPLLSFVLVTYKQEQYIREAMAGVLAQTYSPLEIVVSDDCSPDRTFEIIQEMAAAYQGPHKLILNRNEKNLMICGNFNRAVELSHGELIVGGAGDDISLPHRCAYIAEEWLKPGRRWHSICSNAEIIDESGVRQGAYQKLETYREIGSVDQILASGIVGISGCTHAFSRKTYEVFGPIDEQSLGEDDQIGFRSLILGGVCWIPERLVLYRRHSGNSFNNASDFKKVQKVRRQQLMEKYYQDTLRGVQTRNEVLRLAAQKGILTSEQAERYVAALRHSFPLLQFMVYYNKQWSLALRGLLRAVFTGQYRSSMFSRFEQDHCPSGLRQFLRFCRNPFRPKRQ